MGPKPLKTVLFTFLCLLLLVANGEAQFVHDQSHVEVALRMIGHRVLLSSGDDHSRVLPIEREAGNRYRIVFESEFGFQPEELVTTINQAVRQTGMANRFIVEVEQCETGAVVYSYEMNDLEQTDIIPCKTRVQPKACYSLLFTLLDVHKPMASSQGTTQGVVNELVSKQTPVTSSIVYVLLVFLLGTLVFLWRKRRSRIDSNIIPLGEYRFDTRSMELVYGNQRTELTGKEADLLLLLYNAVNTSVEREVILNKVWGDKGDYVGRTLDVFISKLRKKFAEDPRVKIVNIRGVGYKLLVGT